MKKIIVSLVVCFLVVLLCVPLVSATITLTSSNTNTVGFWDALNSLAPNVNGGIAESFTVNTQGYLASAEFYLKNVGSPDMTLSARLVNSSTGTLSGDVDFTEVYAESTTTVAATSLSTTAAWVSFEFNSTYEIHTSDVFFIVLYVSEYFVGDGSNYVAVGWSSSGTGGYRRIADGDNVWHSGSSNDFLYRVYVSDTISATPTPTPAPTSSTGTGDADIENLTAIILPWLVPLLICLIPALLGYKFVGELGFFIGLNVGVILAYVTLASTAYAFPLWGIILVGVMDVAVVLMRR